MRMKGMVCAIITMMLVTSLTFAAGQGEQEQEEGVVTLNVLNYADMASQEGRTWEAIRDAFMAAHPDIQLEVETLYDEPYHQKLAASVAAGSVPDVMYLWPGGRSRQVTQTGLVADLTPHIEDIRDNYAPSALAPQGDGNLYELPIAVTATHVLYVNTPVLREAGLDMPETYEELREVAAELRDAGKDAVIMANADAWVMNSTLLGTLVGRLGGPTWMEEAVNGEHSFTDPVFVDALELIQDMYQSGVLPNGSIQTGYGEVPSNFAEGRGAFLVDGDWRVGALVPLLSAEEQQEIELTVFPEIPGEVYPNSTSIVAGSGFGMAAGLSPEKQEAALKLVRFFAGPEAARIRLEAEGIIPSYQLDLENFDIDPLAQKRAALYADFEGSNVVDNYLTGQPNDVLNQGMQEIALGAKEPSQVAQEVEDALER